VTGCPQCDVEHPRGAPDCPAQRLGRTIAGRYRIDRLLGIGGMGAVYEATHLELGNRVALKTVRARVAPSPESIERFQREARELAALRHPGIVEVRDLGRDDAGMPFMVMERLEGENLADLLARGPVAVDHIVRLAIEALDALSEAHAHSIVHRDLKPANLFLARTHDGERIKVLDFGIAKVMGSEATTLTETGLMIGSAPYMSPEQTADAKRIDPRSDVYAMGATLYELLTGRQSAEGTTTVQVVVRIAQGDVHRHPALLRPDVPPWLDSIVAKALATDPAQRFQSALEMKRALQEGQRVATLPGGPPPPGLAAAPAPPVARTTPAELAVTAPATPTSARPSVPPGDHPSVPPSSRTPEPAILPPAALRPTAVRPGGAGKGRALLPAGIALTAVAAALVVVVPRLRGGAGATDHEAASDARPGTLESPTTTATPAPAAATVTAAPPPRLDSAALPAPAQTVADRPAGTSPAGATAPAGSGRATLGGRTKGPRRTPTAEAPPPPPATADAAPAAAPTATAAPPPASAPPAPTAMRFDRDDEPVFPSREEGLPTMPSMRELQQRLLEIRPAVNRCAPGLAVQALFQVAGPTGRARGITLQGFEGTPEQGQCVANAIRAASFPRFRMLAFPVQYVFPR